MLCPGRLDRQNWCSKTRLGTFYRALRQAGKPPKLAFIALARKILVILDAVARDQTAFKAA
jgi:transposase